MPEIWKPILNWEIYKVSNKGRIKRRESGKILAVKISQRGYLGVDLKWGKRRKRTMLHVAVLEAFVGPRPYKHVACHRDNDKYNNSLENLFWGTQSENIKQCFADKRRSLKGELHSQSNLTDKDILKIRELAPDYYQHQIAEMYDISRSHVSDIINRRKWSHI